MKNHELGYTVYYPRGSIKEANVVFGSGSPGDPALDYDSAVAIDQVVKARVKDPENVVMIDRPNVRVTSVDIPINTSDN